MVQLGFYINNEYCTGCKACVVACKDKNDLEVGVNYRRVYEQSEGDYVERDEAFIQNVQSFFTSISCNHCENPKCVENCPTGAMHKREEDGVVLVDHEKCIGCKYCMWNCPYGAPQYNEVIGKMTKCNFCIDLIEVGENPACVGSCPMRALDYGPIEELREKYGDVNNIKGLPDSSITNPSIVIGAHRNAK
ncbi:DMSO/selenate family reductase complex B subunit [Robertmurraya massiliosenegalensis]|uniref:DMSO/selenate family reductase complex B subunit n=1 Tax=Robertmurraya massiliosenegalensis TaxID=1287657 RepID=UPI0004753DF3|nr:DMSO/selenate family reductase complex B subunit [Robertmurraya massiliosenegalensis]